MMEWVTPIQSAFWWVPAWSSGFGLRMGYNAGCHWGVIRTLSSNKRQAGPGATERPSLIFISASYSHFIHESMEAKVGCVGSRLTSSSSAGCFSLLITENLHAGGGLWDHSHGHYGPILRYLSIFFFARHPCHQITEFFFQFPEYLSKLYSHGSHTRLSFQLCAKWTLRWAVLSSVPTCGFPFSAVLRAIWLGLQLCRNPLPSWGPCLNSIWFFLLPQPTAGSSLSDFRCGQRKDAGAEWRTHRGYELCSHNQFVPSGSAEGGSQKRYFLSLIEGCSWCLTW